MATTTAKTIAKPTLPALLGQGSGAGLGLCWGGAMLIIMAFWLRPLTDHLGLWFVLFVAAVGVAFLGTGIAQLIWQRRRTRGMSTTGEELAPVLVQRKSTLVLCMWIGAILSLGMAAYIVSVERSSAIGQVSGLVVLGLIAIGGALTLRSGTKETSKGDRFITWMKNNRQAVQVLLFGMAVVAAVGAGGLIWRVGSQVLPEIALCVILALIFAGAGLFTVLATEQEYRKSNLRILVLTVGGLAGLFMWVAVIWQAILWWSTLFGAGLTAWYGPESWKIWVCFYLQTAALAILFGSLLVGKPDMRSNITLRRLLYGYNAVVAGLVLFELLIVLNTVVYLSYPGNLQWNRSQGLHSLSPRSRSFLEGLREPVKIYLLMSQGQEHYFDTRLLENCQAYAPNLTIEEVSPDRDRVRYVELAKKYSELLSNNLIGMREEGLGRGLLIVYGAEVADKKLPHVFVSQIEMGDAPSPHGDPDAQRTLKYKGEDVVMTQLKMLSEKEKKPKIYFTQGNDELDVNDSQVFEDPGSQKLRNFDGCGKLVERLKTDNYEVRSLLWGRPIKGQGNFGDLVVWSKKSPEDKHEVPEDAQVLVIADPQLPFPPDVIEAIERYMERKGKLVVLTNVPSLYRSGKLVDTNLEGLLKKFNVLMEKDFLLHYKDRPGRDSLSDVLDVIAVAPEKTSNKIAQAFRTTTFSMNAARTVKPGLETGNYRAEPLLEVRQKDNGYFWAEKDFKVLRQHPGFYVRELVTAGKIQEKASTQPLPVAVGVVDRDNKPRLVVIGDARFANNAFVGRNQPYYDFLTSSMEWLAESPGNFGVGPKETGTFLLRESDVNYSRLVWLPLALICLGVVALGSGLWIVRRPKWMCAIRAAQGTQLKTSEPLISAN